MKNWVVRDFLPKKGVHWKGAVWVIICLEVIMALKPISSSLTVAVFNRSEWVSIQNNFMAWKGLKIWKISFPPRKRVLGESISLPLAIPTSGVTPPLKRSAVWLLAISLYSWRLRSKPIASSPFCLVLTFSESTVTQQTFLRPLGRNVHDFHNIFCLLFSQRKEEYHVLFWKGWASILLGTSL